MREIKFKTIIQHKTGETETIIIHPFQPDLDSDDGDKIMPNGSIHLVVGLQYTGLKDKNGKEIWEGDMFEVAGNKKYEVVYCEGGESNHEWYGGMFVLWLNDETFFPFDEYAMKNGKVIGNVYLNPELL